MAIQKQGFDILFGQGLDRKTDPKQVAAGKMLTLQNTVFNKGNLEKRDGFGNLTMLPDNAEATTLTTLNGTLLATGSNLYAFSSETNQWLDRGLVQPVTLEVLSLVRNSGSQSAADSATAPNGTICTVYKDGSVAYYQINNGITGQIIVNQTALPSTAAMPRAFVLGHNFIITYLRTVTGTPHLQYIAIPINNPTSPGSAVDLSTSVSSIAAGYDAMVASNNSLYVAWDGADIGGAIRLTLLTSTLAQGSTVTIAGYTANLVSLTIDESSSTPTVWVSIWETIANDGYTLARSATLAQVLAPTKSISAIDIIQLTSVAKNGVLHLYYQNVNTYSYSAVRSDFISKRTVTQAGVLGTITVMLRSVGLASKAFYYNDEIYMLTTYGGAFQPTYFLSDESGNVILKLAYSNGGGYQTNQILPSPAIIDDVVSLPYLFKDMLVSVNKEQGVDSVGGIYSQTGVNMAKFSINMDGQFSSEIASALHLTGGVLWEYDSVKPVEHGFHLWPEDAAVTTATTGGFVDDGDYFYSFIYEWTDAQGRIHKSAPSIPISITTTGGDTSTNTLKVPTLRLTFKTSPNSARIVGYRWSTAQQVFYQFTSISSPTLNSTSTDSVTITDTLADSSILGNPILYTTGGVIENIGAPACSASTLYRQRMFVINSEDPNVVSYSKQVVSGTPVEFSDLFTIYVAPTAVSSGAPGSGPLKCLSTLDDKLILFKKDAIYYVTGNGPDNTGANNDFSEPIFITSTVGCSNQSSIVFSPQGLMFQSDKGIWLLGRDLNTTFIGAEVTGDDDATINSAITVPGTNEVRFTLDNGTVLMYDYYYGQWGEFVNVPAVSSTLFNRLHTYLNAQGQIRQQTPGLYLDGTSPVLIKFATGWLKLSNLQGFQRAYFFYFLGDFLSPHKLNVQIAFDYDPAIIQTTLITPINVNDIYGDDVLYGSGTPYGGTNSIEQWRVFLDRQKCQSIQITISETYNPEQGLAPGAGFTMSGINIVFGQKSTYAKLPAKQSAG